MYLLYRILSNLIMSSAAYGARQLRKYLAPFLGGSSSDVTSKFLAYMLAATHWLSNLLLFYAFLKSNSIYV